MKKKLVYIAHPISGDIENNIAKVKSIYKHLSLRNDVIPFAPYLVALSVLDNSNEEHRKIGFEQNKHFFKNNIIDEMWIYGISNGVNQEIEWCKEFNIPYIFV